MQIAIIQFPGSNCERETALAVKRAGMQPVEFLWNESPEKLAAFQGYIIVGGFSYEDRSRAGIIAALDPIMQALKQEDAKGKPILGICNGAQILVEAGFVPGIERGQLGMALTDNERSQQGKVIGTGYYNAWVHLRLSDAYQRNAFTRRLTSKQILHVPVAHAEGRFVIPPMLLAEMQRNGQHVFQYCDANGDLDAEFPVNPNGSVDNIAAVSNKAGNVMAMMPHPERTTEGDAIFHSMRDYIADGYSDNVAPLFYQPRYDSMKSYTPQAAVHAWIVELVITDNQAMSVTQALQRVGVPVTLKRYAYWEVACDSPETLATIKTSGVLFNDRKERLVTKKDIQTGTLLLTQAKNDMIGRQKQQQLQRHFGATDLHMLRYGVVWQVDTVAKPMLDSIINSHILFNPYAYDCYYF